jgi:hypothetical protein
MEPVRHNSENCMIFNLSHRECVFGNKYKEQRIGFIQNRDKKVKVFETTGNLQSQATLSATVLFWGGFYFYPHFLCFTFTNSILQF